MRTIFASAVNDELIDANPCRIVGAGRANRVHKIRPASVDELAMLTAEMPERLRLMVTLASWCALRFGETIELRRGDIDLSDEVIRIRRAAVRTEGAYDDRPPRNPTPACVTWRSRRTSSPSSKPTCRNMLTAGRDSLLFPADTRRPFAAVHAVPALVQSAGAGRPRRSAWHDLRHSGAVLAAATGATSPN